MPVDPASPDDPDRPALPPSSEPAAPPPAPAEPDRTTPAEPAADHTDHADHTGPTDPPGTAEPPGPTGPVPASAPAPSAAAGGSSPLQPAAAPGPGSGATPRGREPRRHEQRRHEQRGPAVPLPAEDLPIDPDLREEPPVGRPREWDVVGVIALGGGLGSVARYGLARAWPTPANGFPWATFGTNVLGSLALGLLMVYVIEVWPPKRYRRPFIGVGIIGGFTTFSTFMSETRGLLATHHFARADAYALTSLVAGLAAVWTGIALARVAARKPVRRGPRLRSEAGRTATATATGPVTGPVTGSTTGPDPSQQQTPGPSQKAGTR